MTNKLKKSFVPTKGGTRTTEPQVKLKEKKENAS